MNLIIKTIKIFYFDRKITSPCYLSSTFDLDCRKFVYIVVEGVTFRNSKKISLQDVRSISNLKELIEKFLKLILRISKTLRLLLLLTFLFGSSFELEFNCEYRNSPYETISGTLYSCYMFGDQLKVQGNAAVVEKVQGTHFDFKSNKDVRGLYVQMESTKMLQFPKGVEKFFANIWAIEWYAGNLVSITSEDLKPFPELKALSLANNWITQLDGDLFKFSPSIRYISLYNNQVTTVGYGLLSGLRELTTVYFVNNRCIDAIARTPLEIQEVARKLEAQCAPITSPAPPTTTPGSNTTTTGSTIDTTTISSCSTRCSINAEVDQVTEKLEAMAAYMNKFNEFMATNFANSTSRILELEKSLKEILDRLTYP